MPQPKIRNLVFYNSFKEAFETVYPISRFSSSRVAAKKDFNSSTLALRPAGSILAFLGFPMRVRRARSFGKPSLSGRREFFLNFISWPDLPTQAMTKRQKVANGFRGVVAALWHVIVLPFKLLNNVAKFIGAACPLLLSKIALKGSAYTAAKSRQANASNARFASVLYRMSSGLLTGLGYVAYALYFIGRAVVSPVQGIRQAFHQETINPIIQDSIKLNNKSRDLSNISPEFPLAARVFLAGLSGVITVTAYSFLIPMVLPLLIAKIPMLAQVATILSQTKIGAWIAKALTSVGNIVNPVVGTALEALGIAAAPSVMMGAASLFSVGVATVAPAVDKLMDELADADDRLNLGNSSQAQMQKTFQSGKQQSHLQSQPQPSSKLSFSQPVGFLAGSLNPQPSKADLAFLNATGGYGAAGENRSNLQSAAQSGTGRIVSLRSSSSSDAS